MMNYNGLCLSCFRNTGGLNPCPHCGADASRIQSNPSHLRPGTVLNRSYLIGRALGQGGFGITYLALDLNARRTVAVKEYYPRGRVTRERGLYVMPADANTSAMLTKGVNLFFKEALTLGNFSAHPNIVNVFHFFKENNTAYIVMEYINGKSLRDYLLARGGAISFIEAQQILCPIMSALDELHHAGLLHRDIAPDNIYLTVDGHTKLLDFGAARFSFGEETQNMDAVIKPGYAPLEQYSGSGIEQGSWTDVYAMGATFYRALTGKLPTSASDRAAGRELPTIRQLGVQIPETAEAAILRAMNLKPTERYVSMRDFEKDIERAALELRPVHPPVPQYAANPLIPRQNTPIYPQSPNSSACIRPEQPSARTFPPAYQQGSPQQQEPDPTEDGQTFLRKMMSVLKHSR